MKKGILAVFVLLASTQLLALEQIQPDSTRTENPTWLGIGMGTSFEYPVAFNVSLNYQRTNKLLTVRFLISDEMDLQHQSSSESIWDAGLLIGRVFRNDNWMATASVGLGFVGGIQRGEYVSDDETWGGYYQMHHLANVGIPLESQLTYTPSPNVGIGIIVFGNLNTTKPIFGLMLSMQLGLLR